jgi:hypothetical protein
MALQLLQDPRQELVWQVEHNQVGAFDGLDDVRHRDQVFGQFDTGQVLDVFVSGVDDLGQVGAVDFLFKNPHVDEMGEQVWSGGSVLGDNLGDGGTPVTGTNNGNLERVVRS